MLEFLVKDPSDPTMLVGEIEKAVITGRPSIPYHGHPSDQVDVAAVLLGPVIQRLRESRRIIRSSLRWFNLPTPAVVGEFDAIEDLVFVGYPDGIKDEVHTTRR